MTVVVETGAVTAGANSYASVAEATTYLTARAREAAWTAYTTPQKEGYLIEATAYLDAHVQWRGAVVWSIGTACRSVRPRCPTQSRPP